MPKTTIAAKCSDDTLVLENTWLGGLKLLHNDQVIATDHHFFSISKKKPLIKVSVVIDGTERLVEAFAYAWLFVKLQLRVDGDIIADNGF